MPSALMLVLAGLATLIGLSWLALAMSTHWQQVRGNDPMPRSAASVLRVLGVAALLGSLWLCLAADHATMASLVWVLMLTAAALTVAFTLTWKPSLLAPLVGWLRS